VNHKNEYHHRDILKIFPEIKARSLIHWAEIGVITPLSEPENRGGKRVYSYQNLIEIAFIRQLLKHDLSLKEVKRIVGKKKFRDVINTGNYDLVFVYTVRLGGARSSKKPLFVSNWPMREGFIPRENFRLDVLGQASGMFVNLAYLKEFVDHALL